MGLCACNSAGHLSNHAEVAPNHAGITFSISNTLVKYIYCTLLLRFILLSYYFYFIDMYKFVCMCDNKIK